MLHRVVPVLRVVGRGRKVDLHTVLVEGGARERHQVLPADQASDLAEIRRDGFQPLAVAQSPDEALVVRRHELAVMESELSGRRVEEE